MRGSCGQRAFGGRLAAMFNEPATESNFDEAAYLAANPDVAEAVRAGTMSGGEFHFRRFGRMEGRSQRRRIFMPRVLTNVSELDVAIEQLEEAGRRSPQERTALCNALTFREDTARLPNDPFSPAYRQAQLDLYGTISGVGDYDPWKAEPTPIIFEQALDPYPYPFITKDPEHIGNQLLQLGHILRAMKAANAAGRSVIEYGCGTGFITTIIAASGFDVTAVDINADALKVLEALAATRKLSVRTFNGMFGEAPDDRRYDLILFYESFHHCLDFELVLHGLHERLAEGGAVIFANEPIHTNFPKPWGLRLDMASLCEIRRRGWLELGFREDFFRDVMRRCGWAVTKQNLQPVTDIFTARPIQ